jgi:dihydropteroate synthase
MTQILPTRARDLDLSSRVHIMGILNVTPDSFFDGGRAETPEAAVARAEALLEEGADLIDVGGESTRPGSRPVPLEEELRRVVPVVEVLAQRFPGVPISVDTSKAEVARQALEEGASLVNDVSALRFDPRMAAVVKEHGVPVVLMHMRGTPSTMQDNPAYENVVAEINAFFEERLGFCARAGIQAPIVLDPGLGFGKTVDHNVEILRSLGSLNRWHCPLLIGPSRKSFLGRLLSDGPDPAPVEDRYEATLASCLWAASQGARILRVHDVRGLRRALRVWDAIAGPRNG